MCSVVSVFLVQFITPHTHAHRGYMTDYCYGRSDELHAYRYVGDWCHMTIDVKN